MTTQPSMFRTAEGQARYFAAYDATLALWPVPIKSFDLHTSFGSTHVNVCGAKDAAPLVLLPGQAISSTMWYPNIEALSRVYRVYALDIIGDMGKSVRAPRSLSPSDFEAWLIEVFDGLRIERAHIAGLSYGGFIALRLALSAPQRVGKLVLMAPASLLPLRKRYFLRMVSVFLPLISLETKQKLFLGMHSEAAVPLIKQMMTTTDFRYSMFLPPVYTDEQLQQIKVPTLLLLGDHEIIYDYKAALKRAASLIPNIETAIIRDAGHALSLDQPEMVNRHILEFLSKS